MIYVVCEVITLLSDLFSFKNFVLFLFPKQKNEVHVNKTNSALTIFALLVECRMISCQVL